MQIVQNFKFKRNHFAFNAIIFIYTHSRLKPSFFLNDNLVTHNFLLQTSNRSGRRPIVATAFNYLIWSSIRFRDSWSLVFVFNRCNYCWHGTKAVPIRFHHSKRSSSTINWDDVNCIYSFIHRTWTSNAIRSIGWHILRKTHKLDFSFCKQTYRHILCILE